MICSALTFFLFSKLLFTFAVTKPTSTYKQEKGLETFDLPEIVVCPDPGFKLDVLKKYGYSSGDFYFIGYIKHKGVPKLYGWNGDVGVENSSRDILEESLVINTPLIGKAKLWQWVGYLYTGWINGTYPTISRRTLVYPHGCCISFSPSAPMKKTHTVQNVFYIRFNRTSLINTNITTINIFLMDKTSSIRLYPAGWLRDDWRSCDLGSGLSKSFLVTKPTSPDPKILKVTQVLIVPTTPMTTLTMIVSKTN